MKYFAISDRTDSCFEANVAKFERVWRPGACPECSTLPKGCGPPESVVVKVPLPRQVAVSCTSWIFGVIHVDVLEALGEAAGRCLRLGKMVDPSGQPIDDYRTFVGVESVIPRGNEKSQHRICQRCGAFVYSYWPTEAPYVMASELTAQLPIYEFGTMELLVSEPVLAQVTPRWGKLIKAQKTAVRTSPLDGLRADLPLWPTQEQLVGYQPNLPPWMKGKNNLASPPAR